jgi:hypothetical protein
MIAKVLGMTFLARWIGGTMIEPIKILVYECPACAERFRRYEYCEEHIKEMHENQKESEKLISGKPTGEIRKRLK